MANPTLRKREIWGRAGFTATFPKYGEHTVDRFLHDSSHLFFLDIRTSSFARPEELCDDYRMVYIEKKQGASVNELTGAAAFKAIKDYIGHQKETQQPIVGPHARGAIQQLARKEVK